MKSIGVAIVLALLASAVACVREAGEAGARIVLERGGEPGLWRARYLPERATDCLLFQRPASFFRESTWQVRTPGWKLDRVGDRQVLRGEAGASEVVVELPVYTEPLPKEYESFAAFTDGSVAMFTGHLYASPTGCARLDATGEEVDEPDDYVRRLELIPAAGERVVVHGRVEQAKTDWTDPHGDGTYVYFGSIEPLRTDAMVAIVDPGAPGWLTDRLNRLLPEMFALYTERFGEPLPWKPVVLFNFEDVEMAGTSSGGGTLTGLVQMTASGRAWHEATPATSEQLLYLVAHEAAHFWNSQLHAYEEMADSWMHEGSADALARLVLLRSGTIDAQALAQRRSEVLARCAEGLVDGSLSASGARGQFDNYYACGELVAIWSAAALPGPFDDEKIFDVWGKLFELQGSDGEPYDRETYFEALRALGVEDEPVEALRRFIDAEHDDPAETLVELMTRVGIALERLERPLEPLRKQYASRALSHLMEKSCGRYSFYNEPGRLRTAAVEACEPFSRELRVTGIEGYDVVADGDLALEAVAERCRGGGGVELRLEDGGVAKAPCGKAPAAMPAPLGFPVFSSSRRSLALRSDR